MINNHTKKNLSIVILNFIFIFSCIFTGCSTYQQHLGGTGHNYEEAKTTNSLQPTNTKFPLEKNNRYKIPEIPGAWSGPIKDVSPPEDTDAVIE